MNTPEAAVIVCTFNRAQALSALLTALARQTMPRSGFTVYVIDDGSSDDTEEVCDRMKVRLPNLEYLRNPVNLGLADSRNAGVAISESPLLLFVDDDCEPHPDWIANMIDALRNAPIVAGAIDSPTDNFWQLCHNIAQFHPFLKGNTGRRKKFIAGANMGFQRNALQTLGGFESGRRMAEDMEIIMRAGSAGFSVFFEPNAVVLHNPQRRSFKQILEYSVEHAKASVHIRRSFRAFLGDPALVYSPTFLILLSPAIALLTTFQIYSANIALLQKHPFSIPVIFVLKVAWCIGASQALPEGTQGARDVPEI